MRRIPAIFPALLAGALFFAVPAAAETHTIGTITIRTVGVFDDDEAAGSLIYDLANALHIETRESVVRGFLLFKEGQVYDPERIAESERNLRAQSFLRSASITTSAPHEGFVDIVVTTRDSWTTEPSMSFGSRGGGTSFGLDLEESNLLGTGKSIGLLYDSTPDRTRSGVEFHDPAFFRPYWQADALVSENSDGAEKHLSVARPFMSLETPWSAAISLNEATSLDRTYRHGVAEDPFEVDRLHFLIEGGRALHRSSTAATRLIAGFELEDSEFRVGEASSGVSLPEDRHFRWVFVRLERRESDYVKLNWVNRDVRAEDFNLGLELSAQAGFSPEFFGADGQTALVRLGLNRGTALGETTWLLSRFAWETRMGEVNANQHLSGELFGIHRFGTRRPQTFIGRAHYEQGWEFDGDRQLFADAESGLRGYRLHAFEGERLLVLNAEHRIFLGRELFHLVSPGIAFFVDAGGAAPEGKPLDLHLDAGVGLRLGLSRTPRNSLRIDFAWGFDADPLGRKGLITSISMSRAF